ncbi:VWA domain-containing protein [Solirubrobacter sp. CPCC 204708]|uniref:Mg-protoporphyrin IX chelatase n=1 Tax=Solirubrobacter deserti TaxID=2282478 RepID=A0ABT4RE24_9ACTN|nr:VWA domain-containing protein [Solirubrobacter deserti]MBE2316033.1 VWA domain-containing protein [Solirubrobacter deserti]MDA0136785.1 VWA domain-containing protein [Solirubrobacter deserti]
MTVFPFTAIVGQEDLTEALLVCAVDPAISGVLVRGERGTAKTTAVRGLAPLIDGALVELPIGATADRVLGTLDLDRALGEGRAAFKPGLLANAHDGLLYVDEVNLLPDHLVDVLLDAAALGRVHIERDGLSTAYDARFLLVGTMNPEEGDLRPQLLDRFGLSVEVAGSSDPEVRVEIVRRRLAFDRDPDAFAARFAEDERALAQRIAAARERLAAVRLPDRILLLIAGTCARLGVDGHRADIVTARTATALAALDGADEVTTDHVKRAAKLALAHRRRRGPLQQPGLDDTELDAAMNESEPDDDPPPPSGRDNAPPPSSSENGAAPQEDRPYREGAPSRERMDAPNTPGKAPILTLKGKGRGAAGRRSRTTTGEPVDAKPAEGTVTDLALAASLRAAALRGGEFVPYEHIRSGREGNLVVFCVDASGSMGARKRMAQVKAAVLGLLTDAYQRRDKVALVTFRGDDAVVQLPPTSSVERAAEALRTLPTGGRTPLARGLEETELVIRTEQRRDPSRRALAIVVTDGRARDPEAATHAIQSLAQAAAGVVVLDGEQGPVRLGLAAQLARAAGAQVLPLEAAA